MKSYRWKLAFMIIYLALSACATPPEPGSKDEAVNLALERLCKFGDCEGYSALIVGKTESVLTVNIKVNWGQSRINLCQIGL